MLRLILMNQFWQLLIHSGLMKSVLVIRNGIKYHDALVGARVTEGICGLSLIFCSFTTNTSSPPLLLLL